MNLSVKNYKAYPRMSEETVAFNADIYVDGKKIGDVRNDGNGGCHMYYWSDRAAGEALEAWAKEQKTEFDFEKLDQILDKIFIGIEEEKQLRRWCKTAAYFQLKGDNVDQWRSVTIIRNGKRVKAPFTPEIEAWIIKNYGDKLKEILNKRYL